MSIVPINFPRRCLMHHVSSSRNTSQRAVRNLPAQMGRLLAFDDAIFRSCNDGNGHLQQPIVLFQGESRRDHQRGFGGARSKSETVEPPFPLETL